MNILNLSTTDFKYRDIETYLVKQLNKGRVPDKIYVSHKQFIYLLRIREINTPNLEYSNNNKNVKLFYNFNGKEIEIINKDTEMIKQLAKEFLGTKESIFGNIKKEDMNIFPTLQNNKKEKTMKKYYVISSSTYESMDDAIEQINEWNDDGTLDENLRVFEITENNKVFKAKIVNLVEDKEFYDD